MLLDNSKKDRGHGLCVPPLENIGDEDLILYFVDSPSVFGEVGAYQEFTKNWNKIR